MNITKKAKYFILHLASRNNFIMEELYHDDSIHS